MIAEIEQRTPDLPVLIIAGSIREAQRFAKREKLDDSRCFFVPSIVSFTGVRNVRVVWVGTFYLRNDFLDLCEVVDHLVSLGRVAVDRNEVVNKGRKTRKKNDT